MNNFYFHVRNFEYQPASTDDEGSEDEDCAEQDDKVDLMKVGGMFQKVDLIYY